MTAHLQSLLNTASVFVITKSHKDAKNVNNVIVSCEPASRIAGEQALAISPVVMQVQLAMRQKRMKCGTSWKTSLMLAFTVITTQCSSLFPKKCYRTRART